MRVSPLIINFVLQAAIEEQIYKDAQSSLEDSLLIVEVFFVFSFSC